MPTTAPTSATPHPGAPTATSRLAAAAGALPGAAVAGALGAVAAVRRTKPVHPAGRVGDADLEITAPQPEFGVPLLAEPGSHRCTVRFSRTVGLPPPLPDIEGLALRVEGSSADLLFASTGAGRLGRFAITLRPADRHGPQSTVLPVSTAGGSLLLQVTPLDQSDPPVQWGLAVAHVGSEWRSVGVLRVAWGPDRPVRFDPVRHVLPGTSQYRLVEVLRQPAYLLSRRVVPRPRT